jgi:hypothetical protein
MVATHGLAKAGDERCCEFERDLMSLRGAVAYGMDESIIQERAARLGSHVQSLSVLMRAMHACYCRAVGYLLKGAEGHYKQRVRGLALRLEAITPGETADRLQRYVAALEAYFADDPDAKWGAACAHIADDEPDAPSTDGVRKFLARHGVIDRTFIR